MTVLCRKLRKTVVLFCLDFEPKIDKNTVKLNFYC